MEDLILRLNEVLYNFNPYEYKDWNMNLEKIQELYESDPYEVIRILVDMVDELTE